jgi:hypothetical protein
MPLYRQADRIVFFIHIPKTGGSTVEEVLKARGARQALKYHKRQGFSQTTPQHMHREIFRNWVPPGFYDYAFCLVRNPYSRMASEYRYRATLTKTSLPPFNDWAMATLGEYEKNPFLFDNHIRPQVEFPTQKCAVFRLEDGLDTPIRTALAELGMTDEGLTIHHARKSTHSPLDVQRKTIDRITAFYAEDFKTYGYDPKDVPKSLFKVAPWWRSVLK